MAHKERAVLGLPFKFEVGVHIRYLDSSCTTVDYLILWTLNSTLCCNVQRINTNWNFPSHENYSLGDSFGLDLNTYISETECWPLASNTGPCLVNIVLQGTRWFLLWFPIFYHTKNYVLVPIIFPLTLLLIFHNLYF